MEEEEDTSQITQIGARGLVSALLVCVCVCVYVCVCVHVYVFVCKSVQSNIIIFVYNYFNHKYYMQ